MPKKGVNPFAKKGAVGKGAVPPVKGVNPFAKTVAKKVAKATAKKK